MHLSLQERHEIGRQARRLVSIQPRRLGAPAGRHDAVTLLEEQNATGVPWLVPVPTPGCGYWEAFPHVAHSRDSEGCRSLITAGYGFESPADRTPNGRGQFD